jgi:hypothetical protein
MRKTLISINFLVLSFQLLTPLMAENITYYSQDGKIITNSEYKEACKKKAKELLALKEIAKKIEIQKPVIYKNPTRSSEIQLNVSEKKKLNNPSYRKKHYSSREDKDLKRKKLEQEKQLQAMERERLKRQFESEIPGLEYSIDPIQNPSISASRSTKENRVKKEIAMIEQGLEAEEIAERKKYLRLKSTGNCRSPLVKIYDNKSGELQCVHRVIANNLVAEDYEIEIVE